MIQKNEIKKNKRKKNKTKEKQEKNIGGIDDVATMVGLVVVG